jgi:ribonuclease HI
MERQIPDVQIYTDGSCKTGDGGWAAVLDVGDEVVEISGLEEDTTSNRMELRAILEAVRRFGSDPLIVITSDSRYAINVSNGEWSAKKNRDLVTDIRAQLQDMDVYFHWTPRDAPPPEQKRAHNLANQERKKI